MSMHHPVKNHLLWRPEEAIEKALWKRFHAILNVFLHSCAVLEVILVKAAKLEL